MDKMTDSRAVEAQAQGGGDVEACPHPSAPAGMERFDAWFDEYRKTNYTDELLAQAAWKAALAQQPAAVDGAIAIRVLDEWHLAMGGSMVNKYWTQKQADAMRAALTAALAAQPGGSDNDR